MRGDRNRTFQRRIVSAEFVINARWQPALRRTTLTNTPPTDEVTIGLLASSHATPAIQRAIGLLRAQQRDQSSLESMEQRFAAAAPGHGQPPGEDMVQHTYRTHTFTSGDALIAELTAALPQELHTPGALLWWNGAACNDMLLAPVGTACIPLLAHELSRACRTEFPGLQVFAGTNGFVIAGLAPDLVPGLMAAMGITSHSGVLRTSRSNLHIPLRLGALGPTSQGASEHGWSLASALVDTDVAVIVNSHLATLSNLREAPTFLAHPS